MKERERPTLLPFLLSALILVLDQATKLLVMARIPEGRIGWTALGDFFWLVHQRNLGIAFSLGDGLGSVFRVLLFIVLPLCLIGAAIVWYLRSDEPTRLQRWIIGGLVGGGLGNQVDRIFRPEGVVDFLSFRFYGLFGMERFPTFNVADSCIVVCAILLALSTLLPEARAGDTR